MRHKDVIVFGSRQSIDEVTSGDLSRSFDILPLLVYMKSVHSHSRTKDSRVSDIPLSTIGCCLNKACNSAIFSSRWRVYETAEVRPAELPKVQVTPLEMHLSQGWVPVHFTFLLLQASQAEVTFALEDSPAVRVSVRCPLPRVRVPALE